MRKHIKPFVILSSACMATITAPAFAQNIPAQASGNWETPSVWVGNAVPNSSNNVYIGATDPAGAVTTAAVTLTANESISNVFLGYGTPTNGTLNLNGHALTVSGTFTVNDFSGTGHINEGGGSFTAATLAIFDGNSSVTLGTEDAVTNIDIENGAMLTTSATGNLTSGGAVANGAALNLGADMSLSNTLNIEGTGAALNLGGHNLSAGTLEIGSFLTSAVNFTRGSGTQGTLAVNHLFISNGQNLTLIAGDTVSAGGAVVFNGATLTTSTSSNITTNLTADAGTVVLGADLNATTSTVNVEGVNAMLDLGGHNLSAGTLEIGSFLTSSVNFARGSVTQGTFAVNHLFIGNGQNLTLAAGDTVSGGGCVAFTGSTLTTTSTSNITTSATADAGTLTLGANLNAGSTSTVNIEGAGAILNLAGNNLSAGTLEIGSFLMSSVTLNRGSGTAGTLTVNHLFIGNGQNLTLIAGDTVSGAGGGAVVFTGAMLTTTTSSNITTNATADAGTLTLGANLNVGTAAVNVEGVNAALNLAGNNLSAGTLDLGSFLTSSVTLNRGSGTPGTLSLNSLNLANGQNLTLLAGDMITGGGINGVGGTGDVSLFGGAVLSTVSNTNVTCTVNVVASTLNLGADMFIGNQTVNTENGGTVNLAGHNLAASYLLLGYDGTSTVTLNRGSGPPGILTLGNLYLGNGESLTLLAGDTINAGDNGVNVTDGATLTTAATSNISNNVVNVETGGALKLGASLSTTGDLNVQDMGSIFDAQGHAVTAARLLFGSNGTAAVTVSNLGVVTASELHEAHGTSVTLHAGDSITGIADLEDNSALTVQPSSGTSLSIGGTLTMNGSASLNSAAPLIQLGGLSINGTSKLNLEGGKMIVASTPLATIQGYITTGYHSGAWNGNAIFSSTAGSSGGIGAIGYASAGSIGLSSFAGQSVNPTDTLIRYTYYGDANLDGKVNLLDLNALASNFGKSSKFWNDGDFNYDGTVNVMDFNALAAAFNASPLSSPPALGALVPEPGSLVLMGLGFAGLGAARTRKRRVGVGCRLA